MRGLPSGWEQYSHLSLSLYACGGALGAAGGGTSQADLLSSPAVGLFKQPSSYGADRA